MDAGKRYWTALWEATTVEEEKTPWRALADAFGPQRAAFVARALTPTNYTLGVRPGPRRDRTSHRAPHPRQLIRAAERRAARAGPLDGGRLPQHHRVHRVDTLPVQVPLAVGPTPPRRPCSTRPAD